MATRSPGMAEPEGLGSETAASTRVSNATARRAPEAVLSSRRRRMAEALATWKDMENSSTSAATVPLGVAR